MIRILAALALLFLALPALAQDSAEQEKSWFLQFVQNQLSTPNRKIEISDITGVLSSSATIGEITIADREGVWLRITKASIDWNRSALLLRRLDINRLAAERIDVLRKPLPDKSLPAPEAHSFQLPELPLSVKLGALDIARVTLGEDVFGLASTIKVAGKLSLADGSLNTTLDINRLDGPGGEFRLAAKYANQTRVLDLDLSLSEPQNGIIANLLNLDGRPPVDMTLKGSGPLDTLDLALTLDAAKKRVLTGTTSLRRQDGGLGFDAKLEGPIAELVPVRFRAFFGADTKFTANGLVRDGGGLTLSAIKLTSAALSLDGSAETTADGFLRRLKLDAAIADPTGKKVVLPVPGGETTVDRAALAVDFGDDPAGKWTGSVKIDNLASDTFAAETVALDMGGVAENIDQPARRHVTFAIGGKASGITAKREDVAKALGKEVGLTVDGAWTAGKPVTLSKAALSGNGLGLSLAGEIADYVFNGTIDVDVSSIAPFSAATGRDLSGSMKLAARGSLTPLSGGFDLALDGRATDLAIGTPAVDHLLAGATRITGRVARNDRGLTADKLAIGNDQVSLSANGTFATGAADFGFDVALSDLALVSREASGRLAASGRANGSNGLIHLSFGAGVPEGTLAGKPLAGGKVDFAGTLRNGKLDGKLAGGASLGGTPVRLAGNIAAADGATYLGDLDFSAGATHVTGALTRTKEGRFDGRLKLASTDISTAAALFLVEAAGAANADIALNVSGEKQDATIAATAHGLALGANRIGAADIKADIEDLFGVPAVSGAVKASNLVLGGIEVATLAANAAKTGESTDFTADAALKNGTRASLAGALAPEKAGYRLSLSRADLTQGQLSAKLARPASILVEGQNFTIDDFALDAGGGRVEASGKVAATLDLAVAIKALPLSLANAVRPDLALGGTLDGQARVTGDRTTPNIGFSLKGRAITAAALREAGLRSIALDATGRSSDHTLVLDTTVTSPEGLRASAKGTVPLGDGQIAMNVALDAFPLATLNAVAKGQELGGTLSGTARVGGTRAAPAAEFRLNGAKVSAAPLRKAGIAALDVRAEGRYAEKAVTLSSVTVDGPQGLTLRASGRVPLSGPGLGVKLSGRAPLSLADRFLADRGTQILGTVSLEGEVSGSIAKPTVRGTVSTAGAQLVDPGTNIRLKDIAVSAALDGRTVTLRSVSASIGGGGTVRASGTISTDAAAGFPADLRIVLDKARYAQDNLVVATLSGNLAVTGGLTRDPLISGNIDIARAEITVPDRLGGGATSIDVKHVKPPRKVAETLKRAHADDGTPTPTSRPSVARLDLAVSAPNRIFVRGRGLDTELGGRVRLTGPITDVRPVGGFHLIRGRLEIIGQRITFDEGQVSLVGDLNPFLNFVARSEGTDIVVFVTVSGRVSDPKIVFSSQPELPQDEVLARLIFNRGIGELSAFQIAQLAAAAAELAGGSNTSLLDNLRKATGLDDLDVVTDSKGKTAVRAGRYIQENIYLGVQAGAQGDTQGTVNLDITRHLKAKGALGTTDSSLGLFYEKDY